MAASQMPDSYEDRIIDFDILERLKNETSQAIFPDLLKVFLEQGAKRIERIEQAISANDFSTLKNEIHSLKSESATFGAIKLAEFVTHIDLLCKQNENEKAFIETKEIQEQCSLVDSALQKMNY